MKRKPRRRDRVASPDTVAGALEQGQQDQMDWKASKRETKLRPRPRGIRSRGSGADWHMRRELDHLWVGELGREYDRNTPVGRRLLDMMLQNVLQDKGFGYVPDTGDDKLDADLKYYIDELFDNPTRIDLQGEYTFNELSQFVFRESLSSGDIFGLFHSDGPIELREFHLCRQPYNKGVRHKTNHLGVEMQKSRKRQGFWFTREPISPFETHKISQRDLNFIPAWTEGDWKTRNVLHVRHIQRPSQTRGVSVFAPIFDYLGMLEDSQFQQLVKQQLSNMLLLIRNRDKDFTTEDIKNRLAIGVESDIPVENQRLLEELYPGAEVPSLPGEKVEPWAPNIPNSEWFDHMKLVMRVIAIAWGMPYVLMMLDTSDTNFHGYRGAITEARAVFRGIQRKLVRQWHRPTVVHYLHRLADEDPVIGRKRERSLREAKQRRTNRFNLFRHQWTLPGWASVDDLKDAMADEIRLGNSQTSHRLVANQFDLEWEELSRHIVEDKSMHWNRGVEAAIDSMKKMAEYAKEEGVTVDMSNISMTDVERLANRLAPLPLPQRTQMSMSLSESERQDSSQPSTGNNDG